MELGVRSLRLPAMRQALRRALERVRPAFRGLPPLGWKPVPPLAIDLGPGLEHLADPSCRSGIAVQLPRLRRSLMAELGFFMPEVVHRRDPDLPAGTYQIRIKGTPIARGQLVPDRLLAPIADLTVQCDGALPMRVADPATGQPSAWILASEVSKLDRRSARTCGEVLSAHLAEAVRNHAWELLDVQTVDRMIATLRRTHPLVVHAASQTSIYHEGLMDALRRLLRERVSIRDLATILEHLIDLDRWEIDRDARSALLRQRLSRQICSAAAGGGFTIEVLVISERTFAKLWDSPGGIYSMPDTVQCDPEAGWRLRAAIENALERRVDATSPLAILTGPTCRLLLQRILEPGFRLLPVLAFTEIHPSFRVKVVEAIE